MGRFVKLLYLSFKKGYNIITKDDTHITIKQMDHYGNIWEDDYNTDGQLDGIGRTAYAGGGHIEESYCNGLSHGPRCCYDFVMSLEWTEYYWYGSMVDKQTFERNKILEDKCQD